MNNYSPTFIFNGDVQCANEPANADSLVRKQDVESLSYITSIADGSSSFLSVSSGELSVSNLLVTDVKVDTTHATLAAYISSAASSAALGVGDIVVLTAATDTLMYIVHQNNGTNAADYQQITSSLSAAQIVANLSGGTGITVGSDGEISFSGDSDVVSEGSSNLYYTDARSRASISVTDTGGDGSLTYNSSTGAITYTGPSAADVRAHVSAGDGLEYSSGEFAITLGSSNNPLYFESGALGVNYDNSTIGVNDDDELEFKGDTDAVSEGSSNLYHTAARARAAFTAGNGIAIAAGAITFNTGFLRYDEEDVDLTADTAYTLSHGLSEKYVIVQVYDSNDKLIQVDVELTNTNACTITSASNLSGLYVVVKR